MPVSMTESGRRAFVNCKWSTRDAGTLADEWRRGFSITRLATKYGKTRGAVAGKLDRMGLLGIDGREVTETGTYKDVMPVESMGKGSWDNRLFEPWSVRKERLARERNGAA